MGRVGVQQDYFLDAWVKQRFLEHDTRDFVLYINRKWALVVITIPQHAASFILFFSFPQVLKTTVARV